MGLIIGLILSFGLVFGGYVISGGSSEILLHALPYEGMMIVGGAIGAFVIANSFRILKMSLLGVIRVAKGPKWTAKDYTELLSMMYQLGRLTRQKGIIAMDAHIEAPEESSIFSSYPQITRDEFAMELISDSFRMMSMQFEDSDGLKDVLGRKIRKHAAEQLKPAQAIRILADGLPAIGIVAAVLGVIKTMSSIDSPPEILGSMIGGALVGTFLGVFLSYCMVQPIATRLRKIEEDDSSFYLVIADIMVAIVAGYSSTLCVEIGRGNIPTSKQPSFAEVEEIQGTLSHGF